VLEAENAELKIDLESALQAAYQLREDMRQTVGEPGTDESQYDGKDRNTVVTELVKSNRLLRAHQTELSALKEELEKTKAALNGQLHSAGLEKIEDVATLRERLRELHDKNLMLQAELDANDGGGGGSKVGGTSARVKDQGVRGSSLPPAMRIPKVTVVDSIDSLHEQLPLPRARTADPAVADAIAVVARAPVVPDVGQLNGGDGLSNTFVANSAAAARVQENLIKNAGIERKQWEKQNKGAMDTALTIVQSVLRGHTTRVRLQKELTPHGRIDIGGGGNGQGSSGGGMPSPRHREPRVQVRADPTVSSVATDSTGPSSRRRANQPARSRQAGAAVGVQPLNTGTHFRTHHGGASGGSLSSDDDSMIPTLSASRGERYSDEESGLSVADVDKGRNHYASDTGTSRPPSSVGSSDIVSDDLGNGSEASFDSNDDDF
jgi:hypothetical protein